MLQAPSTARLKKTPAIAHVTLPAAKSLRFSGWVCTIATPDDRGRAVFKSGLLDLYSIHLRSLRQAWTVLSSPSLTFL